MLTLITNEPGELLTLRPRDPEPGGELGETTSAHAMSAVVDITLLRRRRMISELEPQGGDAA
jgi:hypothetical protein